MNPKHCLTVRCCRLLCDVFKRLLNRESGRRSVLHSRLRIPICFLRRLPQLDRLPINPMEHLLIRYLYPKKSKPAQVWVQVWQQQQSWRKPRQVQCLQTACLIRDSVQEVSKVQNRLVFVYFSIAQQSGICVIVVSFRLVFL